jgi:hypothetical protein
MCRCASSKERADKPERSQPRAGWPRGLWLASDHKAAAEESGNIGCLPAWSGGKASSLAAARRRGIVIRRSLEGQSDQIDGMTPQPVCCTHIRPSELEGVGISHT